MLCAFSGNFSATIDILRDSRLPNFRVRSDIEPLSPRLRGSCADGLSSTCTPSSLAPAIALSFNTNIPQRQQSHLRQNRVTKLAPQHRNVLLYHWVINIRSVLWNWTLMVNPHRNCTPIFERVARFERVQCRSYGHEAGLEIAHRTIYDYDL